MNLEKKVLMEFAPLPDVDYLIDYEYEVGDKHCPHLTLILDHFHQVPQLFQIVEVIYWHARELLDLFELLHHLFVAAFAELYLKVFCLLGSRELNQTG